MATDMTDPESTKNAPGKTSMTPSERVQTYRRRLRSQQRRRLELCLDVTVIQKMTRVVDAFQVPAWRVVENALAAYCEEFDELMAEQRRLHDERPQVAQCGSPVQVAAYNQNLKRHTDRVSRFLRKRVIPI